MVKEAIATGATTEEAYEKACEMLGVDPADAEFEVLETEEKKRFGGAVCASADLLPPAGDGWHSLAEVRDGNAPPLGNP